MNNYSSLKIKYTTILKLKKLTISISNNPQNIYSTLTFHLIRVLVMNLTGNCSHQIHFLSLTLLSNICMVSKSLSTEVSIYFFSILKSFLDTFCANKIPDECLPVYKDFILKFLMCIRNIMSRFKYNPKLMEQSFEFEHVMTLSVDDEEISAELNEIYSVILNLFLNFTVLIDIVLSNFL